MEQYRMSIRVALIMAICSGSIGNKECGEGLGDSGNSQTCDSQVKERVAHLGTSHMYKKDINSKWSHYMLQVENAYSAYKPCNDSRCFYGLIKKDLKPFKDGIFQDMIEDAKDRGTWYQIINHKLYRELECMFPSRCSGIEHFILKIIDKIPNMDLIINTRDWPQINRHFVKKLPVFSFSKTSEYIDITYPAWTFWEGGPAISLYPMGLGRWDLHRKSITQEAENYPWEKKKPIAFFRGSRTSAERDPLVYLSRENPELVDAQYTKNQAWKSDADTLYAPPAQEVSLESHCHYKYLFNFRGVAASFRFKHLFLCQSLVFHVGDEWIEFFYHKMKPWVHYIPVPVDATKDKIKELINFAVENDDLAREIADRGNRFIRDHLRMNNILGYWKKLLLSYSKLIKYEPMRNFSLHEIRKL
ncbi:O-glucosyltransferase rumi homolog [Oratosquilla oratoria]|uniref:O-glucosyltransferase rumi homolog n=1 Tax=Oratosquilla oratoria TaxID=337810 RepID=UPI003F757E71